MDFQIKCAACGATSHLAIQCWGDLEAVPEMCSPVQVEADGWTTVKKKPIKPKKVDADACSGSGSTMFSLPDKIVNCSTCSTDFLFTEEQQFKYLERGWKPPKICPSCSEKRYYERNYPALKGEKGEKEVLVGKPAKA